MKCIEIHIQFDELADLYQLHLEAVTSSEDVDRACVTVAKLFIDHFDDPAPGKAEFRD